MLLIEGGASTPGGTEIQFKYFIDEFLQSLELLDVSIDEDRLVKNDIALVGLN